jgi:cobalt-zinc-cadmium efflux system outer membrane protein
MRFLRDVSDCIYMSKQPGQPGRPACEARASASNRFSAVRKLEIFSVVRLFTSFPLVRLFGRPALLSLAVVSVGFSQTRQTLTLDDALALAEQYNPQLSVAGAQVQAARAGIVTAKTRPNPDVNYLGGPQNSRLPSAVTGLLQHWGYSQLIELPKIRRTRIELAQIGQEATERALDETRLVVRGAVKQIFYQALRRRGEVELAEEALKLVQDLRQRVAVQVEVGEAGQLELTRAEAEVAQAQTFLRSAQLREVTALAELRAVVSGPLPENIMPQGQLDPAIILPPMDELQQLMYSRHPAMARAGSEVRRSRARLQTEIALRTPQPYWIAEYEQMPDLRFFRTGVSITLPFFNRRQGPIAEATAGVTAATSSVSALQLELRSALERAYGSYQVANQQILSFEQGLLRGAQAALDAAEAAFRFGERGIIEVLDAQRVLRSIRLDYLNAQYDRQAALIGLEQLRAIDLGGTAPGARGGNTP